MHDGMECVNCNSRLTYSTGKHFGGELVMHCVDCDSWFGEESGETVLTAENGGDDVYDEDRPADDDDADDDDTPLGSDGYPLDMDDWTKAWLQTNH